MTDLSADYGPNRSAPHSAEAEQAALGCVLLNGDAFDELGLAASDFYLHKHRWVFDAMRDLRTEGQPVDIITLTESLDRRSQLAEIGGAAYLTRLINAVPTSLHASAYAAIVREAAERRELIALATEIAKGAYDQSRRPSEVRQDILRGVVAAERVTGGAEHIRLYVDKLYDETKARAEDPRDIYGLATGFAEFDAITAGLQRGEVFLLGGEPGCGKSLFLAQMGVQLAGWRPYPANEPPAAPGAIYEMEMGGLQLVRRNVSAASGVTRRALRSGRLADHEWPLFVQAASEISALPVYLSDATHMTTATLRADLARLVNEYGIQWAVIDYLTLLKDRYGRDDADRTAYISAEIHAIAKDLDLAICSIQNLVKSGMLDSVPTLRDFGGSVRLAYDADLVAVMTEHLPAAGEPPNPRIRTITFRKFREDDTRQSFDLVFDPRGIPILRDVEYRAQDDAGPRPRVDTLRETMERQKRRGARGTLKLPV